MADMVFVVKLKQIKTTTSLKCLQLKINFSLQNHILFEIESFTWFKMYWIREKPSSKLLLSTQIIICNKTMYLVSNVQQILVSASNRTW